MRRLRRQANSKRWLRRALLGLAVLVLLVLGLATLLLATNPKLLVALGHWRPPARYAVPVAGVRALDLRSTWGAPRSGGRKHKGVDIFAKKGTPVVSATDGVVWSVGHNRLGGKTVWIVGEGLAAYYYAHLDDWATDLRAGDRVRRGDRLGSVGNTGNARTTPPHLHFSIHPLGLSGASGVDPVPVLAEAVTFAAKEVGKAGPKPGHRRMRFRASAP